MLDWDALPFTNTLPGRIIRFDERQMRLFRASGPYPRLAATNGIQLMLDPIDYGRLDPNGQVDNGSATAALMASNLGMRYRVFDLFFG